MKALLCILLQRPRPDSLQLTQTMKLKLITILALLGVSYSLSAKPLKVYLLVGQSNMQGHAAERTLGHLGMDPKTAPLLKAIQNADGSAKVYDQIWISLKLNLRYVIYFIYLIDDILIVRTNYLSSIVPVCLISIVFLWIMRCCDYNSSVTIKVSYCK